MICRICDHSELLPVLDLGQQPWANNFLAADQLGTEPRYPLFLVYCTNCGCTQLDYTVPKEVMFSNHTYVSGTTKTLAKHFLDTAKNVTSAFFSDKKDRSVLDIGSNDGTQLLQYQSLGYETLGVESCGPIAEIAKKQGVDTVVDYFNERCVADIGRTFDVVNASGVFFHLEELHSAARAVKQALNRKGVFVVQFLYMKSIVENLAFDQIYHEHLLYYTVKTISRLLTRHGLEAFDGYLSPIHGGSIVLFASHPGEYAKTPRYERLLEEELRAKSNELSTYLEFAKRVERMKRDTLEYLTEAKTKGKTIYGFGAPVKGNTFLNYCGIGTQYLDCLVERNALRKGLFSPGMHIPIVMEDEIERQPDVYLVLAWNFKEEILKNNQELISQGIGFFFPVNPRQEAHG